MLPSLALLRHNAVYQLWADTYDRELGDVLNLSERFNFGTSSDLFLLIANCLFGFGHKDRSSQRGDGNCSRCGNKRRLSRCGIA
jgi:hypothetical protein